MTNVQLWVGLIGLAGSFVWGYVSGFRKGRKRF